MISKMRIKIKNLYDAYAKSKIKKVVDVIFSALILFLYFWFFDSMVRSALEVPEMKIEFYIVPLIFMMICFFPYEVFFSRQEKEYQKLKERVKELEDCLHEVNVNAWFAAQEKKDIQETQD